MAILGIHVSFEGCINSPAKTISHDNNRTGHLGHGGFRKICKKIDKKCQDRFGSISTKKWVWFWALVLSDSQDDVLEVSSLGKLLKLATHRAVIEQGLGRE